MANVQIETQGGIGRITVDGQRVGGVTRFSMEMDGAGQIPRLCLDIAATQNQISLAGASVQIGRVDMPDAVERAVYDFLRGKYEQQEQLPGPAALRQMAADLVRLPVRDTCGESYVTGTGAPHRPAGIISAVPADDHRQQKVTLVLDSANGLNRIATDGERNGRLSWTPGA